MTTVKHPLPPSSLPPQNIRLSSHITVFSFQLIEIKMAVKEDKLMALRQVKIQKKTVVPGSNQHEIKQYRIVLSFSSIRYCSKQIVVT